MSRKERFRDRLQGRIAQTQRTSEHFQTCFHPVESSVSINIYENLCQTIIDSIKETNLLFPFVAMQLARRCSIWTETVPSPWKSFQWSISIRSHNASFTLLPDALLVTMATRFVTGAISPEKVEEEEEERGVKGCFRR